jgi:hypothetical protein
MGSSRFRHTFLAILLVVGLFGLHSNITAFGAKPRPVCLSGQFGSSFNSCGKIGRDQNRSGQVQHRDVCVRRGLAAIRTKVRLFVMGRQGPFAPAYSVEWSAQPLPSRCTVRPEVAIKVRAHFAGLRGALDITSSALTGRWPVLWDGKRSARDERSEYRGPSFVMRLGCVISAQAHLRYEVLDSTGHVVAEREELRPVQHRAC